ncbi:MAG: FAD-dependent oxidoreductase [Gammaproteobacteria bacterium]|nr:FAD-dependent oxidoreductase [Gammaproteobacteria bacterium]
MSADVIIIGAGIIGLSTAWQLARRSQLKILVLEKGAAVGEGSTGASSAVCRHRYTLEEMVVLARDGIHAYRHWQDFTRLDEPRAAFQNDGVLWMPGADLDWAGIEHERMSALGIRTALMDDAELQARFPAFSVCIQAPDMEAGTEHLCSGGGKHLLELDGGYMDPVAATEDLLEACRKCGVEVCFRTSVIQVLEEGGRVSGVELGDGSQLEAPLVINAAGPWCNDFLTQLGVLQSWTLAPTRIQVLYLDRPPELVGDIPVTLDMQSGMYFRLQNSGQQLVVGSASERDEQEVIDTPDEFERFPDEAFKLARLHALHHRLPALPYRGSVRGYCGLYTVNKQDMHPIVGETEVAGFYVANGLSGHGFKLAPAIGSLLAQQICGEKADFDTEVQGSFLAPDRAPIPLSDKSVLA